MPWHAVWPMGTDSVRTNRTPGQENTAYLDTTLKLDHFWNEGADESGHHKWAQTVATNDATPAVATNVALATGMDLVYYSRFKTATESTVAQDTQPFVKNRGGDLAPFPLGVMQLLGARAVCVFNCSGAAPVQADLVYSHNIRAITGVPANDGVDRNFIGTYTIRFDQALHTDNYLVFGGAMRDTPNTQFLPTIFSVSSGTSVAARKNTVQVVVTFTQTNGQAIDPLQFWVACIGG